MSIATRTGDDGTTALLFGPRMSKADPRVEAVGTIDELNAALGLARAHATLPLIRDELLGVQKQLIALMGEVGVLPENLARYRADKFPVLEEAALAKLDHLVAWIENEKVSFDGWATPGASLASAALDVARTVCRRAERRVLDLPDAAKTYALTLRYLNRLSDVLWLMARYTETKLLKM